MEKSFLLYSISRGKVGPCIDSSWSWADVLAELSVRPDLIHKLVPPHREAALRSRSIDVNEFVPIPLEQLRITLD